MKRRGFERKAQGLNIDGACALVRRKHEGQKGEHFGDDMEGRDGGRARFNWTTY